MESIPENHCKDCGLTFDTAKSLDVHLQYHKENLMSKWVGQASGSEDNNNVKKARAVAADSQSEAFQFYDYPEEDSGSAFHRLQQRNQFRYQPYSYDRVSSSVPQTQCNKCGYICAPEHLGEHIAQAHPPQYYMEPTAQVKEEPQAEILDLDSHKVHVYQPPGGEDLWVDRRYFEENGNASPEFVSVSTTMSSPSGSELYYDPLPTPKFPALPKAGGAAWKSNEARRPKTYNCSACNKWFTSSGHLKRHYNTTLHKNAVKQSGVLDPASLPMSAHHHPPKEPEPTEAFFGGGSQGAAGPPPPPGPIPTPPHHLAQLPGLHHHGGGGAPQPEYPAYMSYPNAEPPHVISGEARPLPSFSEFQQSFHIEERLEMETPRNVRGLFVEVKREEVEVPVVTSSVAERPAPPPVIHKCVDCDKTFNKACYLTQHNKSFHCGDKPYKCSRCGKRFTQEYLHLEHLSKHAGEKPHKCEICPKQFNHKTDLRRHMCLHSGDKPYSCDFCGKGFIRKDHMLKHAETHKKKQNSANQMYKKLQHQHHHHLQQQQDPLCV